MELLNNNLHLIGIVIVVAVISAGIRITRENERFVVITLGKNIGIKGPGLLFKWPNSSIAWHRVALNEDGEYLGDGLVKVKDAVFPAESADSLKTGDKIKISSFRNEVITVIKYG